MLDGCNTLEVFGIKCVRHSTGDEMRISGFDPRGQNKIIVCMWNLRSRLSPISFIINTPSIKIRALFVILVGSPMLTASFNLVEFVRPP